MLLTPLQAAILTHGAKQIAMPVGGSTKALHWSIPSESKKSVVAGKDVDTAVSKLLALGHIVRQDGEVGGLAKTHYTTSGQLLLMMQPGQPVTMQHVADAYPGYIVSISPSGHEIGVQGVQHRADPKTLNLMGHQNWIVEMDKPQGGVRKFTRRVRTINGEKKAYYASPGSTHPHLSFGRARYYYCWEF